MYPERNSDHPGDFVAVAGPPPIPIGGFAIVRTLFAQTSGFTMAETPKLSVEKALEKLRRADAPKSRNTRMNEEIDAIDEEIKRLRAQRLRLDRQRSTKRD